MFKVTFNIGNGEYPELYLSQVPSKGDVIRHNDQEHTIKSITWSYDDKESDEIEAAVKVYFE